jgi:hypothetical protein
MKSLEEVDQFAIEIRACEKKSSEEALERWYDFELSTRVRL